jgi:hypothetical protein
MVRSLLRIFGTGNITMTRGDTLPSSYYTMEILIPLPERIGEGIVYWYRLSD